MTTSTTINIALDFSGARWLVRVMDSDIDALIRALCARIGMMLEDASPGALALSGPKPVIRADLVELCAAVQRIKQLCEAALALREESSS